MKIKALALLLALFTVLSLVACDFGGLTNLTDADDKDSNKQTEAATNDETEKVTEKETAKETEGKTETNSETTAPVETESDEVSETKAETTAPSETESETESETGTGEEIEYNIITIAEALALCGEPGNITEERYYIKGIIKTVSNAEYGTMIITDATGEISVYGTYSSDGALRYSELAEKPYKGDEVLLHCILQNYSGTKEIKNARLISFVSNQGNFDISEYKNATIAEARAAETGAKLKVSGIVARITYANGMKPSGFILVNGADSIYVYDGDAAARVAIGNRVELAGSKTYWILDTEQNNAALFGYKGCNQLESVTLISNDNGNNAWINNDIPQSTVKDIIDTPVTEDITTQVFKVNALVSKNPGNGFVNYYIYDLDGKTGAYTYTQCNGSDFAWLDEFDGKICTVYLVALNAKSTKTSCNFRLLPVAVEFENFTFNTDNAAEHAVKYYGTTQFKTMYTGNPALKLTTSVSSQLLGFENATLTYTSSDETVISITVTEEKTVMSCLKSGTATITVTGSYNGNTYSDTVNITVAIPEGEVPAISVGSAIEADIGEVVTVKGIVGPSLVNKTGFYLIDESGAIAILATADVMSEVQLGQEIIINGTKSITKDGEGQIHIDTTQSENALVLNNYGEHNYSTSSFITGKTVADIYALDASVLHTVEVYIVTATINQESTAYSVNSYLVDGDASFMLYAGGKDQYKWLADYNGQTVTVAVAVCDWNNKGNKGCVLYIQTADGTVIHNTLNFNK